MLGQRLRQRAVATAKIKDWADSDLGKPLGYPVMHIADHGKVLGRQLVGGEPLEIIVEVSGQGPAFQLLGLLVLVGRLTRPDHLASPHAAKVYSIVQVSTVL
jgi:hypothetical protein